MKTSLSIQYSIVSLLLSTKLPDMNGMECSVDFDTRSIYSLRECMFKCFLEPQGVYLLKNSATALFHAQWRCGFGYPIQSAYACPFAVLTHLYSFWLVFNIAFPFCLGSFVKESSNRAGRVDSRNLKSRLKTWMKGGNPQKTQPPHSWSSCDHL